MKKLKIKFSKKSSLIFILIGICFIVGAVGLLLYTELQEWEAQEESHSVAIAIVEQLKTEKSSVEEEQEPKVEIEIDGETYIGILIIPQLELELPVANTCSMTILKQSPCVFTGSLENKDCIIAAHNYEAHFRNIGDLVLGDEISILDVNGKMHTYQLILEETIQENQVDDFYAGEWDLTLFTCLYGNNTHRVVLRFEEVIED